jgi:hypothetical protein
MIIGIQKRQLFLLLFAMCVPFLLNAVGLWQDVGTAAILKMLRGAYPHPLLGFLGGPYNPLPEIFWGLLFMVAALGLLAWLTVFLSNKAFFQNQPTIAKFLETILIALLVAAVFEIVTGFLMPLIWLPIFQDYLIGFPGSLFMEDWSRWLVFPITAMILFVAMFFFGKTYNFITPPAR